MSREDGLGDRLVLLGDMLSDGDLDSSTRKDVNKEYKQITRKLYPEIFKEARQKKRKIVDEFMVRMISENKCICGGEYKQSRSGSKVCYCKKCNRRVRAVLKKRRKNG